VNVFARWRRSALVGIEIGPDAVRLLQLTRGDAGWQVGHYACEPLPPGAVMERQVADIEAVGAAIARARAGLQARYAAVALSAPMAVLRLVTVPAGLGEADLDAQLELEAARILPAAHGPLYLDFEFLGPLPDDPNRVQVLLAVAQPAPVNRCIAALKRGGLRAAAVDVEALALARALAVLADQTLSPEQVIALNRQTVGLPEIVNILLAQTLPPEAIANNAPALLLACGLALREISA